MLMFYVQIRKRETRIQLKLWQIRNLYKTGFISCFFLMINKMTVMCSLFPKFARFVRELLRLFHMTFFGKSSSSSFFQKGGIFISMFKMKTVFLFIFIATIFSYTVDSPSNPRPPRKE